MSLMVMKILNQPFFCFREKEHTYESRVINTHVFIGASSGVKTHMDLGAVTEKKNGIVANRMCAKERIY